MALPPPPFRVVSMDAPTAAALDALNAVGARLKEAKASSSAGVAASANMFFSNEKS